MKIIVIFILLGCVFSQAQVSYNQEFQVNRYTEDYQYNGRISMLSDSGFVICWQSGNYQGGGQDGSGFGIFAQVYNSDGTIRVNEFQVNTYSIKDQKNPRVSQLAKNGFVICWESADSDSGYPDIYAQIYNNNGTIRGNEFRVNTYTYHYQTSPDVKGLVNGGFVVCWTSGKDYYIGSLNGYAKIFNDDGSTRTEEFRISSYLSGHEFSTRLAAISDGGFVICWVTDNRDGDDRGIFAHIFSETGTSIGDDFLVNTTTLGWQYDPCVTSLSDSGFVICWPGIIGSRQGIFGQLFNNKGEFLGTEFQVDTIVASNYLFPNVASLSDGGFVVIYPRNKYGGTNAQLYNKDGLKNGREFSVTDWNSSDAAQLTDNGFIVVWATYTNSNSDIYYKYYKKEINHPLISFSLEYPDNDELINSINPLLMWRKASLIRINIPWEIEYSLYFDEDDSFTSPTIVDSIYDTTYTVQNLTPGTTYFWKVLAKNIAGDSLWSSETNGFFVSHDATGIKHQNSNFKSQTFELLANYPNPFNPETTIKYNLPAERSVYQVKIKIYDALGRLIITLKDEQQNSGLHMVKWNGKNTAGQNMPSGIYFCLVEAGQFKSTQKMLLVR